MSTFNSGLPANTTKIREYPDVLQNNFNGIKVGDLSFKPYAVNLPERTSLAPPYNVVPTRSDDTMILYADADGAGSGETELWVLDDRNPANEIQLTQDGDLGASGTTVRASALSIGSTPLSIGINQMVVASGSFDTNGTLLYGVNMAAVSHPGTGSYNVAVNADVLLNSNYIVLVTVYNDGTFGDSERVGNVVTTAAPVAATPTNIAIKIRSGGGSSNDQRFNVVVIGGR